MSLLALDLGTTTGYKVGNKEASVSGTFDLKPSRWEGGGMRGVKFRAKLNEMHAAFGVTHVVYEAVHRHRGTDAAHIYGGLLMILTAWCEENSIPYEGVGVGTIKKFWTGNGIATKDRMIAVAEERGFAPSDDNEADAIALFEMKIGEVWSPAVDPPMASGTMATWDEKGNTTVGPIPLLPPPPEGPGYPQITPYGWGTKPTDVMEDFEARCVSAEMVAMDTLLEPFGGLKGAPVGPTPPLYMGPIVPYGGQITDDPMAELEARIVNGPMLKAAVEPA